LLADVTELQNAWERSGKFEGDSMLTEEEIRNGMSSTASPGPDKVVPFVTDDAFSEYYNTKFQIGMRGVEGYIHSL
jgi:hypothetical protein